jgi:hypothetical protein
MNLEFLAHGFVSQLVLCSWDFAWVLPFGVLPLISLAVVLLSTPPCSWLVPLAWLPVVVPRGLGKDFLHGFVLNLSTDKSLEHVLCLLAWVSAWVATCQLMVLFFWSSCPSSPVTC